MAKTISTGFINDKINGININSDLKCNSGNYTNASSRTVSYVVMHYTGNAKDTAKANANYFTGGNRQASAHFFVDDTSIYQSVELRDKAWHCGTSGTYYNACRNATSIGIEMCCTAGNYKISDKTKNNAAYLCAYLCKLLGITASNVDTYVVRHYDVTHKNCPAQMAGNGNAEWTAFKTSVKNILNSTVASSSNSDKKTAASSSSTGTSINTSAKSYKVKVTTDVLNIRKGAGTNYAVTGSIKDKGTYTIVAEATGKGATKWGKLKSGAGWIALDYTKKL